MDELGQGFWRRGRDSNPIDFRFTNDIGKRAPLASEYAADSAFLSVADSSVRWWVGAQEILHFSKNSKMSTEDRLSCAWVTFRFVLDQEPETGCRRRRRSVDKHCQVWRRTDANCTACGAETWNPSAAVALQVDKLLLSDGCPSRDDNALIDWGW